MWILVLVMLGVGGDVSALTVAELSTEQECYDAQVIVANESPNPSAVFICLQQVEIVAQPKG